MEPRKLRPHTMMEFAKTPSEFTSLYFHKAKCAEKFKVGFNACHSKEKVLYVQSTRECHKRLPGTRLSLSKQVGLFPWVKNLFSCGENSTSVGGAPKAPLPLPSLPTPFVFID